jgi:hypothetical protein
VPVLPLKVVIAKRYVTGIPHNANDLPAAVVEVFVRLDDPWSRRSAQSPARLRRSIGYQAFNVLERNVNVRINQIRDQEPRPRVARTRIRNQKRIIRKNGEAALGNVRAQQLLDH